MKTILILTLLSLIASVHPLTAQKISKAEKAALQQEEFIKTRQLVESNRFRIDIDRVYPQGGKDVTRFNPRGTVTIDDTLAKGTLPFFGRAYSLPYGEGGGIEFDAPVRDRTIKIERKKKRNIILYQFSVKGKGDTYRISLEINAGGNCSVNLISNNRASISYSGTVSPLKE